MRDPSFMVVIGAMMLAQGCSAYRHGAPSEKEFRLSRPHPHVADADRADKIIAGARRIHICSSSLEVRTLMGEPDFAARDVDSVGRPTAARWTYVLREDDDRKLERTVAVTIDARDQVISIFPTGIPAIPYSVVIDDPGCEFR